MEKQGNEIERTNKGGKGREVTGMAAPKQKRANLNSSIECRVLSLALLLVRPPLRQRPNIPT